jgi:hypothetical protein
MGESIEIPARFNGPLDSGNGGYSSGVIAALLDEPAEVSLRSPVPLDTPLAVERADGSVRITDGETLVGEGRSVSEVGVGEPAPVTVEQARAAMERYRGATDGPFCRCFVCGLARDDALGVFAGEVEGRDVVASTWTPPEWTAGDDGLVCPEFVWAVMDCPTFFAAYLRQELPISVLARETAQVLAPVPAGQEHVVMAWPLENDGRKRHVGSAVCSAAGELLAIARVLMVEPRAS